MSEKETNTPSSEKHGEKSQGSLLGEILSSTNQTPSDENVDLLTPFLPLEENIQKGTTPSMDTGWQKGTKKPKKQPMKAGDFLRIIGAVFLVTLIFFGAFLAYIVFNPWQAYFFLGLGINPGDIASLLHKLVNAIFGTATFFVSVVWVIFLFRAILTKKEYRKKKTIAIIASIFICIILFAEITLWAYLLKIINATDYQNLDARVLIYDNEKLHSDQFKENALLQKFDNLIGPLELKFDLKTNSDFVGKSIYIEDYKITIDGALKKNTKTNKYTDPCIIEGINPGEDQSIICLFNEVKTYKPSWVYNGTDKLTRKSTSVSMDFSAINIVGIVDIRPPFKHSITYDASSLGSLGNIAWYTEASWDVPASNKKIYSTVITKKSQIVCLNVFWGNNCDKILIVPSESDPSVSAKILYDRDPTNPLLFIFSLSNVKVRNGEITEYNWETADNANPPNSKEKTFSYIFPAYRDTKVTVNITDSAGNVTAVEELIPLVEPLKLVKWPIGTPSYLKIADTTGNSLVDNTTYNPTLQAYYIPATDIPATIWFDATDVQVENPGYELTNVEWNFDGDESFEKTGLKSQYELITEKRYTILVRYTFTYKEKDLSWTVEEKIIFEPTQKAINFSLKLTQDSDYVPATVSVDGSATIAKEGEITKFIYDFGEKGKWPVEGDAIRSYRYSFPGEYTIIFSVVKSDGTRESISRKIVLKESLDNISINTSVSSGVIGGQIDFKVDGNVDQIRSYQWNFWDSTSSIEPTPSHTYNQAGKQTIKLTVVYANGTTKDIEKTLEIKE